MIYLYIPSLYLLATVLLEYSLCSAFLCTSAPFVVGPDPKTKPDYDSISGPLGSATDQAFLRIFHASLYEQVKGELYEGNPATFEDITQLAMELSEKEPPAIVQSKALETLRSLFPSWLPKQYRLLFSRPFPEFSCRMNAWATWVAGTWLMGKCIVNDEPKSGQGLHVERCRFLESSGCASVCVNACKIPTQTFFEQDMGIFLTMEPNYETYECQFSFGKVPTVETELSAMQTPCLAACPSVNRKRHPTADAERKCSLVDNLNTNGL